MSIEAGDADGCELEDAMTMRILNGDHAQFELDHADTPPHLRPDWPLSSFDARDWAKAFLGAYEKAPDGYLCQEIMTVWFAHALMRGYDERKSR
jgi:hypothetical protein